MAFEIKHALTMTAPDDAAFENNPSDWNAALVVAGADVGGIPYCPTATTIATSANLLYTETSGPRLQVGSGSGTSTGLLLGYSGTSTWSGIWRTGDSAFTWDTARLLATPTLTIFGNNSNSAQTYIDAQANIYLRPSGSIKVDISGTAGAGPSITAGTATTDVNALSATQTWNAAGVAFTGWKFTITDTASAAGSLAMQILGGASGTTNLISVSKAGNMTLGTAPTISSTSGNLTLAAPGGEVQVTVPNVRIITTLSGKFLRFQSDGNFGILNGAILASGTAPTVASGFGTSPSISAANGSAVFTLTIGTSTTGVQTGTLTMPAATTGWACACQNVTNPDSFIVSQTGGSTTTITLKNYDRTTGLAADFTASDVIRILAFAY